MAVFTPVSAIQAQAVLERYQLGDLVGLEGIAEGVENSNFRLQTTTGVYALTLFEKRTGAAALPFCLSLMDQHARSGVPAPAPHATRDGDRVSMVNDRPAVIVDWLEGSWLRAPRPQDQYAAGAMLARMHCVPEIEARRPNPVGPAAWHELAKRCAGRAEGEHARMAEVLAAEVEWLSTRWPEHLPSGAVHADYFPDNVLFSSGSVTGVIDYYFACTDAFAYDLAVALSAWGFDRSGSPDTEGLQAFRAGYDSGRSFSREESQSLPLLCRGAAVRFSLTRLHDALFHDPRWQVTPKDPRAYVRVLRHFQAADNKGPRTAAQVR